MPGGSRQARPGDPAPRAIETLEVVFEGREARTATPRVLPVPAGQPEGTEAGRADRCAGPGCGNVLERRATGRPARFCSARCRQAARRKSLRAEEDTQFRDTSAPHLVTKLPAARPLPAWKALEREEQRGLDAMLGSQRQSFLRRPAAELLRLLGQVDGPDEPATRELLAAIAAGIEQRRVAWPG